MEEADVKQLISLIESAQLQYEVDESGTVSIVCDPVQLVDSSEGISNTILVENEGTDSASLLTESLDLSQNNEELDKQEVDAIPASGTDESDAKCLEVTKESQEEEKDHLEKGEEEEEEASQDATAPELQLTPSGHYFFQTPDGQFIQVLGSFDESIQGGPILGEGQTSTRSNNDSIASVEAAERNMQIFVVGSNGGEEVYLINAPEQELTDGTGGELPVSAVMLKDVEASNEQADLTTEKLSANLESKMDQPENLITVNFQEASENLKMNFLGESSKEPTKKEILNVEITVPQLPGQVSKAPSASPFIKNLLIDRGTANRQSLESKTKPRLPVKMQNPPISLTEGMRVHTDRGEMVALNLSSVTQSKQVRSTGQKSLKSIASLFGSVVKVLRPVKQEKPPGVSEMKEKLALVTCDECGAILHSQRSLQIHHRRYHQEWQEECFVCGEKFYNMSYVRAHIQKAHSQETSFQCRFCSFNCNALKEFLCHRKVHEKSKTCSKCGKKYMTLRIFREHLANCKGASKTDARVVPKRKIARLPSTDSEEVSQEATVSQVISDEPCTKYQKMDLNVLEKRDGDTVSTSAPTKTSPSKRTGRYGKISQVDEAVRKKDAEFKLESKHYRHQIQKMTEEQHPKRVERRGRGRTHRCYLCFKLFSTADELDAHKETYHQAKSARPVRVRTDATLEEEDGDDSYTAPSEKPKSRQGEPIDEVYIKDEPVEFAEEYENVTIILDEVMKSTHVIKPLCIACKTVTSTDYKKSSKWFSKIPDNDQFEALKKFEQFFPCAIDPEKLKMPWVLCKMCVLLIDKIADMEEKLNSMKSDMISRFKGSDSTNIDSLALTNTGDSSSLLNYKDLGKSRQSVLSEGIGKNLADIEAYMKDTCEIMEITRPHKKPGRPRRQQAEKLTPVIISEDEDDEPSRNKEVVKIVQKELKKEAQETLQARNCDDWDEIEVKRQDPRDREVCPSAVKEEPMEDGFDDIIPSGDPSSWDEIGSNSLACLDGLQEEFLMSNTKERRAEESNSQIFPEQSTASSLESSVIQTDHKDEKICKIKKVPLPHCSSGQIQEASDKSENEIPQKNPDMPVVFDSNDTEDREKESVQNLSNLMGALEEATNELAKTGEKDAVTINTEKNADNIDINKLLKIPGEKVLGRKRSAIREEKNKMSYRVEGVSAKPWACSECHKGFSTQRGACDHYAASHGGQNYSCEYCNASYVRKRDLIGHYNKVHLKSKPYKCKVAECEETFSSHGDLYRHISSAHNTQKGLGSFTCHNCYMSFARKKYLDAHLAVCETKGNDQTPYKCAVCDKSFKLLRYLRIHMQIHGNINEQYYCEICNKVLTDKRNLILHMKSHTGETTTSCKECGKTFNRKSYLWTHMRIHTNERPYGCNYCFKWFKQYSTWKNHERTHTGEKPYKCHICQASFTTSSSMSKHLQYAHLNIRDFTCELCKKSFICKPKLDEHMKVHTGEKPYECHICNRAFNKKNNLRTHMYIHSSNKRYKCELCGEGFMRRTAIENHILDRHRGLEFVLGSNVASADKDGAAGTSATSPFISIVGAEEGSTDDGYIVIVADDEEKELENLQEMQVTVLAEGGEASVAISEKHLPLAASCTTENSTVSVGQPPDVLSRVLMKEEAPRDDAEALIALMTTGDEVIVPTITMQENGSANINQVMEIDPSQFNEEVVTSNSVVSGYTTIS